jgi:hypothetical protein
MKKMKSISKICLALILVCAITFPAIAQEKKPIEIKPIEMKPQEKPIEIKPIMKPEEKPAPVAQLPDLKAIHTTTAPIGGDIPRSPGEVINFKVTVKNIGGGVARGTAGGGDGYWIALSLSARPIRDLVRPAPGAVPDPYVFRDGMLLKGGSISRTEDLAPGASKEYTTTVEIPKNIKPGKYWIGVSVDPYNKVAEGPAGEANNVSNHGITVR